MALASMMSCDSQPDIPEPLVISSSAEINGSLFTDAIVQKNCSVHVRGSVTGSLTIEPDADVLVDGSVYGKITNRGGRLAPHVSGLLESHWDWFHRGDGVGCIGELLHALSHQRHRTLGADRRALVTSSRVDFGCPARKSGSFRIRRNAALQSDRSWVCARPRSCGGCSRAWPCV
jgi:hypothetical protein